MTCDDFRAAMADANGINLDQFALWYSQAGTPVLDAQGRLKDGAFELTIKQTHSGYARYGGQAADDDSCQNRFVE